MGICWRMEKMYQLFGLSVKDYGEYGGGLKNWWCDLPLGSPRENCKVIALIKRGRQINEF